MKIKIKGKVTIAITVYPGAIKGAIVDTNYTQKDLAKVLNISQQYLCDLMHGRRFSIKYLDKIAALSGHTKGYLYYI